MTNKAVLADKIYLNTDKKLQDLIRTELTYKFYNEFNKTKPLEVERTYGKFKGDIYTIPIGRQELIPEDFELVEKRVEVPAKFPEFRATLRESQQKVYDDVNESCMINAPPSWGKTFTALAIAKKLEQKTLVCVHTTDLRNQWAEEVRKQFGFEPGVIGGSKYSIHSPIVIGNIQSLVKKQHDLKKTFGLIFMDEVHHVSATSFRALIHNNYARYKIGLSGTLRRKDGKHVMFRDFFGSIVHKPSRENYMVPRVVAVRPGISIPADPSWAKRVNKLYEIPEYMDVVVALARKYSKEGHKVLVVGERVEFLQLCHKMMGSDSICVTGTTEGREQLLNSVNKGSKSVLFGSRALFSEGISLDSVGCLILAAPINNDPMLEQLIGRVIRVKEGKQQPVIVDIILEGPTATKQWNNRLGHYMRQDYKVEYK